MEFENKNHSPEQQLGRHAIAIFMAEERERAKETFGRKMKSTQGKSKSKQGFSDGEAKLSTGFCSFSLMSPCDMRAL